MALTASDYTKAITEDLKSIPDSYLPIVANIVNSFKESVTHLPPLTEKEQQALAVGIEQANNGEFATDEQIAEVFSRWGVDVKD